MDARHHLFELFDAHGDELFALAGILSGSAAVAERAVMEAFSEVYDEMRRASPVVEAAPVVDVGRMRRAVCERCRPARRRVPPAVPTSRDVGSSDSSTLISTLRSLPADQRDAVALHCWLGLDDHALGAALGASPADARALVQRGIAAIGARRTTPGGPR